MEITTTTITTYMMFAREISSMQRMMYGVGMDGWMDGWMLLGFGMCFGFLLVSGVAFSIFDGGFCHGTVLLAE